MADETVLVDVNYDTDEAQNSVVDLTDDIFRLTEANKILRQEQKKFKSNTKENIEIRKRLNRQIEANKDAIKRTRKERNESLRVIKKEQSSFQRLSKTLKSTATSYFGVVAAIGIVVKGISSIIKSNVEFEQSLSSLSAITGLVGSDLDFFADKAKEFSKETTQSATEILQAFELVGSARPELLKNSQALAEVTKQAIILSEATGGTLGLVDAANAVTNVMNQMGQSSDQASRIINILAAGSKEGSAQIPFLTEAFEKAGTSANLMGLSVEEVTGALEANAPFFAEASVLGNSFDKVLLKLKSNQIGYASGTFDLNDAIDELREKYENGTSAADIFGVEHAKLGELLVQNQDQFNTFTESVTGTTTALEQQAIQNDTLGKNWKKLMNGIKNLFISTDISGFFNTIVKDILKSFDRFSKKIDATRLVWQRLKGELTKAEYRQALEDLNNGVNTVSEAINNDTDALNNNVIATEKSINADKKKTLSVKELAAIEEKKAKDEIERRNKKLEFEISQDIAATKRAEKAEETELERRNRELEEEILADIATTERLEALEERKTKIVKAAEEKRRDVISQILGELSSFNNDFANLQSAKNQNRLNKELAAIEEKSKKEIALANGDADKITEIEEKAEKDKLKAQKKAAKEEQKIAIRQSLISGALVVLNALLTQPFIPAGLIAAVGAGVATALQIATIKQQTFGKGGKVQVAKNGMQMGTFAGASHSGGGIDLFTGTGQHVANVEDRENFYVVNKNASDYINTLSDINQRIGGGIALSNKSRSMQDGGQADLVPTEPDVNINDLTERVIDNFPPIIVGVESIKTGIEQFDEVVEVGVI